MKRRLGLVTAVVALLTLGSTGAQALVSRTESHWGCVGVQAVDLGVCVSNPLPERLPLPD